MRFRYALITILILAGSFAATFLSHDGKIWFVVAGLWLACLAGVIGVLDRELKGEGRTASNG